MRVRHIFDDIPEDLPEERFDALLDRAGFRLERIVSRGHVTPKGQWYDQDRDEWVMVLRGRAALRLDGQDGLVHLRAGDYILIPAHLRHRVEWTDPEEDTVWLALHDKGPPPDGA